ncbi:MAG TPA: hypothetical protein VFS32_12920 [Candidatus Limnocylindrales bacterium]|nr:hypothetical protein [Candidatus Limnocylindrales bacterium]
MRFRPLVHLLAGIALAAEAACVALVVATIAAGSAVAVDTYSLGGYVLGAAYPLVGWIVASRRPRNPTGWLFLVVGLSQALDTFNHLYSVYGLVVRPGSLPLAAEASWVGTFDWAPGFVLLFLSVLVFPEGRLPSPRWRPVAWMAGLGIVLFVVPTAAFAWPDRGVALTLSTPDGPAGDLPSLAGLAQGVGLVLSALVALLSVVGLAARFRAAEGVLRQQLKWFSLAGAVEVLAMAAAPFLVTLDPAFVPLVTVGSAVVAPLLPIAAGIAILRYRLYDIDRIVSRTIAWSAVTALLAAVFVVLVLALQAALATVTSGGPIAVAASTLVVASLFQPLRRRVQDIVDARFNRRRYDVEREIAAFVAQARDEVEIDRLAAAIGETLGRTMQPTRAAVWLRTDAST